MQNEISHLINSVNYVKLVRMMTDAIEGRRTSGPVALTELVELGRNNRDSFEKTLRMIEAQRLENPHVKRKDYQRVLMRKRRQRLEMAEEAYNITPRKQQRQWSEERRKYIAEAKARGDNYRQAVEDFWEMIDRELYDNVAKKRSRLLG